MPQPTANAHERNLTMRVCTLKISLILVPLRKPMISGIPDPAAAGWYTTSSDAMTRKTKE